MSVMNTLPFDPTTLPVEDWARYVSAVLSVCGADELSATESAAVDGWLAAVRAPSGVRAAAAAMVGSVSSRTVAASLGNGVGFVAPFVIRDALRLASVDGLGPQELTSARAWAASLGVSTAQFAAIEAAIAADAAATAAWRSALSA